LNFKLVKVRAEISVLIFITKVEVDILGNFFDEKYSIKINIV